MELIRPIFAQKQNSFSWSTYSQQVTGQAQWNPAGNCLYLLPDISHSLSIDGIEPFGLCSGNWNPYTDTIEQV